MKFILWVLLLFTIGCENHTSKKYSQKVVSNKGYIGNKNGEDPIVTVSRMKDTVHINEKYSAYIQLKNPVAGYNCTIYKFDGGADTTKSITHEILARDFEATYTVIPKTVGEHTYLISIIERMFFEDTDSLLDFKRHEYKGKYWVVP